MKNLQAHADLEIYGRQALTVHVLASTMTTDLVRLVGI